MTNQYRIYQNDNLIAVTKQKKYQATQLIPDTNYRFSVAAFNEIANGKKVTISLTTQPPNQVKTFDVTIYHFLNGHPKVEVQYFAVAMGSGPVIGDNYTKVNVTVDYVDNNRCIVHVPIDYKIDSTLKIVQGCWYLSDSNRTLKFILTM